ncbi:hypothetical protein P5673_021881, partial [Acropora cervicornis]
MFPGGNFPMRNCCFSQRHHNSVIPGMPPLPGLNGDLPNNTIDFSVLVGLGLISVCKQWAWIWDKMFSILVSEWDIHFRKMMDTYKYSSSYLLLYLGFAVCLSLTGSSLDHHQCPTGGFHWHHLHCSLTGKVSHPSFLEREALVPIHQVYSNGKCSPVEGE